jgi:hypothetical protein
MGKSQNGMEVCLMSWLCLKLIYTLINSVVIFYFFLSYNVTCLRHSFSINVTSNIGYAHFWHSDC